jgi:iturin family lipopeptide synthetase C
MQAVWGIILGKYTGKQDVVFGIVVSGRPSEIKGVESMVGIFINTIPLRIRFERDTTFSELLKKIQAEAVESTPYHHYPLARIQAESVLKQRLLDHIMVFENFPLAEQLEGVVSHDKKNSGGTLKIANIGSFEQSNYDFNIVIIQRRQLSINFLYNGNVYEKELVERIASHFDQVLEDVLNNEEITVDDLILLSEEEKMEILEKMRGENQQLFVENIKEDIPLNEDEDKELEAEFEF